MNLPTLNEKFTPQVCCLLRTKTAFGSYMLETDSDGHEGWQSGDSTTAVFWCLKTMETCGPDDDFAHPQSCRAARECFQADDE